jgi:exonuclease SbcC
LDKDFKGLMETMERQIMTRVYSDFNSLFENWFDILVDSETLKIKLDNEFTPLIEQNGYDIEYGYLSGGERTAAALAYRLALNQVINNLMSKIRTRNLLILDEPTDGFSAEQLDRIRLVLNELDIKQIIIVSHESKIESFVDNVLRFGKKDHVSGVI